MNTRHRDKLQKNVFFKECVKLSINTKSMILLKSQLITSCNKKKILQTIKCVSLRIRNGIPYWIWNVSIEWGGGVLFFMYKQRVATPFYVYAVDWSSIIGPL